MYDMCKKHFMIIPSMIACPTRVPESVPQRVFVGRTTPLVCADLAELAVGQRLGENAVVDEAEGIPFWRAFGLEVPEDPNINFISTILVILPCGL
jgi:hypothetical protein